MMMNLKGRKNSLYIANILTCGKIEKSDILAQLDIAQSTLYKHLHALKENGFQIKSHKNIFELIDYKHNFNLSENEINLMCYLMTMAYVFLPLNKQKHIRSLLNKILLLSNKKSAQIFERKYENYKKEIICEYYSEKITALKKHFNQDKRITIITKKAIELSVIPIEFEWKNDKIYLKYLTKDLIVGSILVDNIVKIVEKEIKFETNTVDEVIFELYGKLSKSYLLKENERIVDSKKDTLVVASNTDDKEKLFKRLLRYDVHCKVLFPKQDVEKFKEMIDSSIKMLSNLDT